jgi:iron complex transport system substrate-binding protein
VLYALGEQDRIAGISGYTVFPKEARKEKPKVFAFTSGDLNKILAVQPDLVLTFSNLQADISRELIQAGVPVYAFNQRSVDDILGMIATVGRLVGAEEKALAMVAELEAIIADTRAEAAKLPRQPRVYFEEWDDPQISGIRWVSEMIEIAGGIDIFADPRPAPVGQGAHPRRPAGSGAPRTGHHHRLLVRQALSPGARGRA